MFETILIANRGEIACRIISTARRMGLRTIAIYSEADRMAPHAIMADEAYEIGPSPASESYLQGGKILDLAITTGADCIHPGYGFLSENAEFAEQCAEKNIEFIGPPVQAMRKMGRKDLAKEIMKGVGIPVIPGFVINGETDKTIKERVAGIGLPVMVKAVSGGGGKGLRLVENISELEQALAGAMREAQSAFGDNRLIVEKYLRNPRHIEVQIFGDKKGNIFHLFERDCSLQRRHQKVIEESPAPGISDEFRTMICEAAMLAARTVDYQGAGTVEFIAEGWSEGDKPKFYFIEMNTRLQVEHPVTEMITELDLVEWQIRVAAGEPLPESFSNPTIRGHAVEARLYAEDPENDFLPSTGKLLSLKFPVEDHVRIDTGVKTGYEITPYYDSMIAKVIAHGKTRKQALTRLKHSLQHTVIAGPKTNAGFLLELLSDPDVKSAKLNTGLIADRLASLVDRDPDPQVVAVGTCYLLGVCKLPSNQSTAEKSVSDEMLNCSASSSDPWGQIDGFQLGKARIFSKIFVVDGKSMELELRWEKGEFFVSIHDRLYTPRNILQESEAIEIFPSSKGCFVVCGPHQIEMGVPDQGLPSGVGDNRNGGVVLAPMHGKIVQILTEQGNTVNLGQSLIVLEAMKMEHIIRSPIDGFVAELPVAPGQQVSAGDPVVKVLCEVSDPHGKK